ncbi:MAG TPA: hypothetical protein VFP41_03485 [Actinomycetota bacterium]|nr:hypothetical protein [Actinomycetota bacterium]
MEEQAGTPRRSVFRRLENQEDEPLLTSSEHRISASLRRSIDEQLEQGLRALEEQATDLMREIAAEIWRASGNDMRPEQERIVSLLSRDQAIKTLITSNDERFQSLALRSARVEDTMNEVAENGKSTRDAIEASMLAIREIADSPTLHGVEGVRTQLEQVEHHIAAALSTMQERDRAIVETVTRQVRDHGRLLTEETAKVIGAIDAYVQTGAEAMGTLSRRVEEHAEAFAEHDGTLSQTVADRVAAELTPVTEQLEMLAEKVGLHGRDQEQVRAAVERLVEARIMGVAHLIRADSEALRGLIEERTEVQADAIRETVDRRMAAFAERMDERLGAVATDVSAQVADQVVARTSAIDGIDELLAEGQAAIEERLAAHIDDRMASIAKLIRSDNRALASTMREQQAITPSEPLDAELVRQTLRAIKELQAGLANDVQSTVDVQLSTISDQLHKETQSTTESMVKVAEVLGEKIDRLTVRVDEGVGNDMQVVIDRMTDAIQAMSTTRRSA